MISVAMTTYNGEKYVVKQIQSVLSQTLPVDEIVICDDKSTDNTVEIVRELQKTCPVIKLYVNDEKLGYIKNFRKSISLTNGDYIFLSDQDDEWERDKVEITTKIMKDNKACAICTDYKLINQDSEEISDINYHRSIYLKKHSRDYICEIKFCDLIIENVVQGCTYCFNKEVKNYYVQLREDILPHDYQILFVSSVVGRVIYLNKPLIKYRIHDANVIGIDTKDKRKKREIKNPLRLPNVARFIKELDRIYSVKYKCAYIILLCSRIPYLIYITNK